MNFQNNSIPALPSTQEENTEAKIHIQGSECVLDENVIKNRQWTDEEHILYIIFLELNREKIKSKLIRRSNSFYKEMCEFVKSKTAVQCRSHNQKYEQKYKYPHRIIRQEKQKMCRHLYEQFLNKIQGKIAEDKRTLLCSSRATEECSFKKEEAKSQASTYCQTQIQGTNLLIVTQTELLNQYQKISPMEWHYQNWMLQQQWTPHCLNWFN